MLEQKGRHQNKQDDVRQREQLDEVRGHLQERLRGGAAD